MPEQVSHTPGPWTAQFDEMGGYDCMTDAWDIYSPSQHVLAVLDVGFYGQTAREPATDAGQAIAVANARLIAAAPELLAALKSLMELREAHMAPDDYAWESRVKDAYAAIAKAEGRA